jgi:DNA-binding transcriptional ArsR family regulator
MGLKKKTSLSMAQLESVAALFGALSDPLRLAILQSLCEAPRCVSEIVDLVGTSQANVSKHLAKLVSQGVLSPRPNGRNIFYQLANGLPLRLCELVQSEMKRLPAQHSRKTPPSNPIRTATLAPRASKP